VGEFKAGFAATNAAGDASTVGGHDAATTDETLVTE
jgi:hypothetical protein